ncbi:DUF805 domain-containing protein [Gynuella sunshinyii]|uniref:Putative membrane protein n=1 Tax=Gynuella sunshinyii YC6258 TaxID=1445510 RepID=A0A0C5VDS7_9GAMM|nr:DUF805 domain-containing protein [Gynuella sunshinyii]AJQ92356.1 putative membrane protein [Gynuella sunshinyii YC6258]
MSTQNPYQAPTGELTEENELYGKIRLFSPATRIGRIRYQAYIWVASLIFYLVAALFSVVAPMVLNAGGISISQLLLLATPLYLAMIYYSIVLMIQRLHDLNRSGWFSLLILVPLVNAIFMLWIVFAPGTPATNDYGHRPPPNKIWHWLCAFITPLLLIGIIAAIAMPAYNQYVERAQSMQQ